jgi:hypothetical protein
MIKCDNCSKNATYKCADFGLSPAYYCLDCLPSGLRFRAEDNQFELVNVVEKPAAVVEETTDVEEAPKPSKKKKAEPSNADSN